MNTYKLVNPYLEGTINTSVKAKNSHAASKKIYKELSKHFNSSAPNFFFTIQKGGSGKGKYYSFRVRETFEAENEVNSEFKLIEVSGIDSKMKNFKSKVNKVIKNNDLEGGAKKKTKSKKKSKSKRKPKRKSKKNYMDDEYDTLDDLDTYQSPYDSPYYLLQPSLYLQTKSSKINYWLYNPFVYETEFVTVPTLYSYVNPIGGITLLY